MESAYLGARCLRAYLAGIRLRNVILLFKDAAQSSPMTILSGTTTMPLFDIVQPFLTSTSRSYPIDTPDLILIPVSMIARLILAPGSILTSSNIIDSSAKASLSTITHGDRIDFHTVPPLMIQPAYKELNCQGLLTKHR
jgi:hypothetical protein